MRPIGIIRPLHARIENCDNYHKPVVLVTAKRSNRPKRQLFVDPRTEADSRLPAQKLPSSNRCNLLAAIPVKGEVLWEFLISILVRMSIDHGMLEAW